MIALNDKTRIFRKTRANLSRNVGALLVIRPYTLYNLYSYVKYFATIIGP